MPTPSAACRRHLLTLLILLTLCALGPSPRAHAQAEGQTEAAAEANLQFNLGVAAFRKGDYEQALSHFFISNRLAPNHRLFLNIALCYEQLSRYVEAYRYYDAFAAANEDPQMARSVQEALARVKPYVALLRIDSDPPGATIFLNRRELGSYGVTPRDVAVVPADYQVILELRGHQPLQAAASVGSAGAEARVSGKLERILGTLQLGGSPEGATVTVEDVTGEVTGALPARLDLTPGEHIARVQAPGFKTRDLVVVVRPAQEVSLRVDLERQTGALVVQSEERDAQILLDGNIVGFTPAVIESVPVGEHTVVVQSSGFKPFVQTVVIEPDGRYVLDARLSYSEDVAAASRVNESVRDAPASVTLISRREIEAMGYVHVADALQGVRGIYLSEDGAFLGSGVRGFSVLSQYGNRTQVLVDGHTMNESWLGQSFIDFTLMTSLYDIEQIEVVRGPTSALYGTNAFFGVVNVITPKPTEAYARAGASIAGPGVLRAQATAAAPFADGQGGVWVGGGGLTAQGRPLSVQDAVAYDGAPLGDLSADSVGAFQAGSAMAKLWWRDLTVKGYFAQRDKDLDNGAYETVLGSPASRMRERRAFGEARYEPKISDTASLLARVSYDHFFYEGVYDYQSIDNAAEDFRGQWITAEASASTQLPAKTRLSVGASYQYHFQNQTFGHDLAGVYLDASSPFHQASAFAIADSAPLDWLKVSAALRFDSWFMTNLPQEDASLDDRFFFALSPRLALIFKPTEEDTIKVMGGRAFRAPSIYELSYNDKGITQVPSPELQPETVWTGELEYTRALPWDLTLTASMFLNAINNFITQSPSETTPGAQRFTNSADDVYTLGGELELRRYFKRGWMFAAQTSLQSTRVANMRFFDGPELRNSPASLSSVKLVVPIVERYLRFGTRLSVESGRFDSYNSSTGAAVLWDATFSGEDQALGLQYAIGARNLLDWRYFQPQTAPNRSVAPSSRVLMLDVSYTY
jgi:outer membrane receptor protein involved in Fe transport